MQRFTFAILLLLLLIFSCSCSSSPHLLTFPASTCDASLGDCPGLLDSQFLMDSDSHHRILAAKSSAFISYSVLTANRVPCSSAGRSYYNCKGSGAANPYTRGCSRITRCHRDTS